GDRLAVARNPVLERLDHHRIPQDGLQLLRSLARGDRLPRVVAVELRERQTVRHLHAGPILRRQGQRHDEDGCRDHDERREVFTLHCRTSATCLPRRLLPNHQSSVLRGSVSELCLDLVSQERAMSDVQRAVKEKYGALAAAVSQSSTPPKPGCCGPAESGCGDPITSNLYSAAETGALPAEAVAASLGCGNPTALLALEPGQTVLDLGSGGGIDV